MNDALKIVQGNLKHAGVLHKYIGAYMVQLVGIIMNNGMLYIFLQ